MEDSLLPCHWSGYGKEAFFGAIHRDGLDHLDHTSRVGGK